MRTGFANMGLGLLIAAVGALVTGLTYSMVSSGGGTYVVAYGAFVVGAWRFLLGLFQILRSALVGPQGARASAQPATLSTRADTAVGQDADTASRALRAVAWVLVGEALLRVIFLCLLLSRIPVAFLDNLPFFLTGVALPASLALGGLVAGALLLRNRPAAIPFGIGLCVVGLLYEAYVVFGLLSVAFRPPWFTWALIAFHLAVYSAGLIAFIRQANLRRGSVA